MSGEYLPDFEDEEVEIARVSLASATGDVISIRARREDDRIRYEIVDEYETVFHFEPTDSAAPLTLGELIDLIDGVTGQGTYPDFSHGLTDVFRNSIDDDAEKLVDFVTVSSDFYPDLEQYYASEADAWLQHRLAELREPEDD